MERLVLSQPCPSALSPASVAALFPASPRHSVMATISQSLLIHSFTKASTMFQVRDNGVGCRENMPARSGGGVLHFSKVPPTRSLVLCPQ